MKLSGIKRHLRSYSIKRERETTINHAFASALAPHDDYDDALLDQAMSMLGQTNFDDLQCVYCSAPATSWDHLVGLVKNSELNGYGHQIGNLVPCCRDCNSSKGNKDWREFLRSRMADPVELQQVEETLETYLSKYATKIDLARVQNEYPKVWDRYKEIQSQIIGLMEEADTLTYQLRSQDTA